MILLPYFQAWCNKIYLHLSVSIFRSAPTFTPHNNSRFCSDSSSFFIQCFMDVGGNEGIRIFFLDVSLMVKVNRYLIFTTDLKSNLYSNHISSFLLFSLSHHLHHHHINIYVRIIEFYWWWVRCVKPKSHLKLEQQKNNYLVV